MHAGCIPNPESFATVSISSTDAFDTPEVDTNIYGAPGEVETMIQCLNKEREVIKALPANFNMTELPRFSANITAAEVWVCFSVEGFLPCKNILLLVVFELKMYNCAQQIQISLSIR